MCNSSFLRKGPLIFFSSYLISIFFIIYKINQNYCSLRKLLENYVKILYTIFKALSNVKDKYHESKKTGVYQIPVRNHETGDTEVYIDATRCNLEDRIREHYRDVELANCATALSKHGYEADVEVLWNDAKVVKTVPKHASISEAEKFMIYKKSRTSMIINDKDKESISKAWISAINY